MQRTPATVEEQLILKALKEECTWENLPKRLHSTFSSREEWHKRIIEHCIKKRLQWSSCFARRVIKESDYYEEMMHYLRKNFALFPYHLAEYVCRVMRVSPFRYYCDMIFEVMKNELPYDSIPNFSAADALRITGVGRNEFIDIMNKCKSKKLRWKLNKSIAKELLPSQPVDFPIEPWWGVCLVNFTVEEFKKLSEDEIATIDKVCKEEANSFVIFDPVVVKGLYRRGLVYFDVIIYPDDRFKVSRLEGFVSNKDQTYEDPIEELLYAVFVVSSENATVAELAATLQADLLQLQAAASLACRLGWAVKIIDPASILHDSTAHGSLTLGDDDDHTSRASIFSAKVAPDGVSVQHDSSGPESRAASNQARVAFVVDANITSYLMMGSVSPGLKSHAVTLYEAGKLGHTSIADLCRDLSTLEGAKFEGELQEFANHASSLRCVLECLLAGGVAEISRKPNRTVSVGAVETSLTKEGGVPFAEISHKPNRTLSVGAGETSLTNEGGVPNGHSITSQSQDAGAETGPSGSNDPINTTSRDSSKVINAVDKEHANNLSDSNAVSSNGTNESKEGSKSTPDPDSDPGTNDTKRNRNYRVDILRCESLANLAPATLDRLFRRDYDFVLSTIPLPPTSVLPGPTGPIHFGPPSYSSMTPWMKLVLYSSVGIGPLSVVLMKGQYLRLLPSPLAGCEKALLWSWDGSTVGGLGDKREGNLVKGTILLHCLNSLLRHSSVLVQPLSKNDLDGSGKAVTIDVPLPLRNSDGSLLNVDEELGVVSEEIMRLESLLGAIVDKIDLWTIGYIRLLRLFIETESNMFLPDEDKYEWVPLSLEFGVPLFSPKLCKSMCRRVVGSQLLQTKSFDEHHEAMQGLRRRLRDMCAEYSATGHAAKLLYQKEKPKETSSRQLLSFASARWNPLLDPYSPRFGATAEYQKRKLAVRQRSRREVLSFDGSVLRSYALTPMYETVTRSIEEPVSLSPSRSELDDVDNKEPILPGVSLLFNGEKLEPIDMGAFLQARQPISLIAVASSASSGLVIK